jgi:hypothetical protein
MMKKRIHRRFPTEFSIPSQIDFVGLTNNRHGLLVEVCEFASPQRGLIEIDFGQSHLAFRSMDEGNFLAVSAASNPIDEPDSPIVLVENSDFETWLHAESLGIHQATDLVNVAILTQNEWVEVISNKMPVIRTTIT